MKVRVEIDENLTEEEVVIRCSKLDEVAQKIYDAITDITKSSHHFLLQKENSDYYVVLDQILFFETSDHSVNAHTAKDVYETAYRLYELEELLPKHFMRVSKSTILNTKQIYSISKNLTSSSKIELYNTHKQVYVSRAYFKSLQNKLEEKRRIL